MDHSLENHASYVGKHISELPTPSFVVSLPVVKRNVEELHRHLEKLNIGFRPHVKTLKVRLSAQRTPFVIMRTAGRSDGQMATH